MARKKRYADATDVREDVVIVADDNASGGAESGAGASGKAEQTISTSPVPAAQTQSIDNQPFSATTVLERGKAIMSAHDLSPTGVQSPQASTWEQAGSIPDAILERERELRRAQEADKVATAVDRKRQIYAGVGELAAGLVNLAGTAFGASPQAYRSYSSDWRAQAERNARERRSRINDIKARREALQAQLQRVKQQQLNLFGDYDQARRQAASRLMTARATLAPYGLTMTDDGQVVRDAQVVGVLAEVAKNKSVKALTTKTGRAKSVARHTYTGADGETYVTGMTDDDWSNILDAALDDILDDDNLALQYSAIKTDSARKSFIRKHLAKSPTAMALLADTGARKIDKQQAVAVTSDTENADNQVSSGKKWKRKKHRAKSQSTGTSSGISLGEALERSGGRVPGDNPLDDPRWI